MSRIRRLLSGGGIVAIIAGLLLATAGASAAQAAPPYSTSATVTDISFVDQQVVSGNFTELTGSWSLPNGAVAPAGFTVPLPAELQGRSTSFPLRAPDNTVIGQCTVNATQLWCDIDLEAPYVVANPNNLHGSFNFWVAVLTTVTESESTTYEFGDVTATVTVIPPAGPCTENCEFTGTSPYKFGRLDNETGIITWWVRLRAPKEGFAAGQEVTVVDRLGANQKLVAETILTRATVGPDGNLGAFSYAPAGSYTVSPDYGTVTFTSEAGYFYEVLYHSEVTDNQESTSYSNAADIKIGTTIVDTVTDSATNLGGGGTGSGDAVGEFTITKSVIWDGPAVEWPTFSGTYTVTEPGEATSAPLPFTVTNAGTWTSPKYPKDSVIHIDEVVPTTPSNISWGTPEFTLNDFTLVGGQTLAVSLKNPATLRTGTFTAKKQLTGDGASLVPTGATFALEYSYPAGVGYAEGSGTLTLPADGTAVSSPELPLGAVVTLTEGKPAAVPNATWGTPVLSTSTLTIGDDTDAQVIVSNPITKVPTPSPSPSTSTTPPAPQPVLAGTGQDGGIGLTLGLLATGLIVIGAVARARLRVHRSSH